VLLVEPRVLYNGFNHWSSLIGEVLRGNSTFGTVRRPFYRYAVWNEFLAKLRRIFQSWWRSGHCSLHFVFIDICAFQLGGNLLEERSMDRQDQG
jgi:hypothetical protein